MIINQCEDNSFNIEIFEYSPLPYYIIEVLLDDAGNAVDFKFRYCNKAFADIKGFTKEEIIGCTYSEVFSEGNEQRLDFCYKAAYENTPVEFDEFYKEKESYYHVNVMPIGRRGYCAGLLRNVRTETLDRINTNNELKTALQELKKEKYVLDKLCTDFTAVYYIDLLSGEFEVLKLGDNTNASRILNGDMHKFKHFNDFTENYANKYLSEEERGDFRKWLDCNNMRNELADKDRATYHYMSIPNSNNERFFEVQAVKVNVEDEHFNIFLSFRYIDAILNKEKKIQEELKSALDEAKLNNEIISSSAKTYYSIYRIDLQADHFEEISNHENAHRLTGNEGVASEKLKDLCDNLVSEEYQEEVLKFMDLSTLADRLKEDDTIATEYLVKDGNWHMLRFIVKKKDEMGKVTNVLCVVRSISDTKRREQNLLYLAQEAKRSYDAKTRFLSDMSHDIRTPINGIVGMLDIANHYADDLEVQQNCRNKIMESSKYLISLVNDVLDMNKLESGNIVIQDVVFDLTELLIDANNEAQELASKKGISYNIDWVSSSIQNQYLIGNPKYVRRIISNLANNAIKFNRPGGSVQVSCREISNDGENVVYQFICKDTGIGMSDEFVAHAYDMFSKESATSRSTYEGTGLGLAIVKELVDKLNGTIELTSKQGLGTTFIVNLPFKIGSKPDNKENLAEIENVDIKGLHALIVEDNEINTEIVQFMLENNGLEVTCAVDGIDAIEKFSQSEPGYFNIVFMDIMMPRLNGLDATRRIRQLNRADAKSVPIIAMTANAFTDDVMSSYIAGMNLHLAKPLSEKKIINAVKQYATRLQ